jgi:proton glutamate symport protein
MLIGVVFGFLLGPNSAILPQTGAYLSQDAQVVTSVGGVEVVAQAQGIRQAEILGEEDAEWLHVSWTLTAREAVTLQGQGISASNGQRFTGYAQVDPIKVRKFAPVGQSLVNGTEWIGRLFLAMIKMVVVPLVFFSLILGMASLGDFRKLGKMGGATLGFFTFTTVVSLTIGLIVANVFRPGDLISNADKAVLLGSYSADSVISNASSAPSLMDQLVGVVPSNPFAALASGDMLQVIFFAAMIGIALTLMEPKKAQVAIDLCDTVNEVMVVLVNLAMKVAPFGVAAILFQVVGTTGLSVLVALAAYAGVVLLGLFLHITLTYAPLISKVAGLSFFGFLGAIRGAIVLAFSTSSSSATLPVTMEACEDNLKVSSQVSSFVLPIGATVNMDGTALYQGVAAVFIAQMYGMELSLVEQGTIVVSATMASVGAAGVPGAGMLTLAMVLGTIGVPVQGIALVIGVDRILDMFRTATNVIGDSTAAVLVAKMQGDAIRVVSPDEDASNPDAGFEGRLGAAEPTSIDASD